MVAALTDPKLGVLKSPGDVTLVGHRVVHGGERFQSAEIIDDEILAQIDALSALAPLHNPINVLGIREARQVFSKVPHVAVFDTAFHHTLPPYAYLYGLPYEYYEEKRIRRYGFHGTSHSYVALKAAEFLHRPFNELEIVTCHLGNGASLCAVDHGRSVDTTMGLTPAEGLIMGTRCGDIDPGCAPPPPAHGGLSVDEVDALINRKGGLKGLSGHLERHAGNRAGRRGGRPPRAPRAQDVLLTASGRPSAPTWRPWEDWTRSCSPAGSAREARSREASPARGSASWGSRSTRSGTGRPAGFEEICRISPDDAPIEVLVVPTDEERMIARETLRALERSPIAAILRGRRTAPIPLEVSAHHVHLTQEHVEQLFGSGRTLTKLADLSQPGQFSCHEQVTLVGPKGSGRAGARPRARSARRPRSRSP